MSKIVVSYSLPDETEQRLDELEQTVTRFAHAIRTGTITVDPDTLKRLRRFFEHH